MTKRRLLFFGLLFLLLLDRLGPRATARTYTDQDVRVMKQTYEPARTTSEAKFPTEIMREPWHDPVLVRRMLPYGDWDDEYRQYFQTITGDPTITLKPTILVMHFTACSSFETAWNVFYYGANMSIGDRGTRFGHPSVHFMIDRDGTVYQLMPLDRRATGTYGVNHCALQVEMVAADEADLVHNTALVKSSLRLARWLMATNRIPINKVYGHYEVSTGKSIVPEYLDLADATYPTSYPPSSTRTDPGALYMSWLRYYLTYAH